MITGHGDTETLRTPDYETALDAAPRSGGSGVLAVNE
jgi:hypothetical protein